MAGTIRILDTAAALAVDTERKVQGGGAHRNASFYALLTIGGGGGSWAAQFHWSPDGTAANSVAIATTSAQTVSGIYEAVLQAPFTSQNRAIPEPNIVFWNESIDGSTVTGTAYAMYGD